MIRNFIPQVDSLELYLEDDTLGQFSQAILEVVPFVPLMRNPKLILPRSDTKFDTLSWFSWAISWKWYLGLILPSYIRGDTLGRFSQAIPLMQNPMLIPPSCDAEFIPQVDSLELYLENNTLGQFYQVVSEVVPCVDSPKLYVKPRVDSSELWYKIW